MNISKEAEALSPYIQQQRRHFHQYPELSFKENQTTAYLAEALTAMGYAVTRFEDYTGLLATLQGKSAGKTVLLRSDIDALPITEETRAPFASQNPGVMHACGHDCHMAMLLGTAKLLAAHQEDVSGTVKLLFQAAEESGHGAPYYLEHDLLQGIDGAFGMHMSPYIPKGQLNIQEGPRMAACSDFTITVTGLSAHGSTPHLGHDAIVAASSIIMNLQTAVSRLNDPLKPLVVTIGKVRGGKQFNIICGQVVLEGTIRCFDPSLAKTAPDWVTHIAKGTAETLGCSAALHMVDQEPPVVNDHDRLLQTAQQAAKKVLGEAILTPQDSVMASEDFAYIMDKIPSVFCFLGARDDAMTAPLHSPHFLPDDSLLWHGTALEAQFALDFLEGKGE